jgi:hypothetical protein
MKLKILVVSLATVLLGAGITGAVVFANGDSGGDREARVSSFAGRVAAILELEAQTVEDALTQASRELREEQLNEKIDLMLENGRITGERAEELRQQLADGELWDRGRHGSFYGKGHRFYGDGYGHKDDSSSSGEESES